MFQLDDKFLEDIGLAEMPADEKAAFLDHIYNELELRVGTKLSDGLSEEQLEQFEKIIDKDEATITAWLDRYVPDYHNDEVFLRLQSATKLDPNDPNLRSEYVATKWLEVNRPDYRQVVSQVLDELKREISSNKDKLVS